MIAEAPAVGPECHNVKEQESSAGPSFFDWGPRPYQDDGGVPWEGPQNYDDDDSWPLYDYDDD